MLSIENSIIEILINNQCDLTYKVHPDRQNETLDLYRDRIKKYELKKFEKIYNKYDVIIFSYPHTTTFFYALDKCRNIIFFDNKLENYLDEKSYKYIDQKAIIINYSRIKNNNFKFDENKINNYLKKERKNEYSTYS